MFIRNHKSPLINFNALLKVGGSAALTRTQRASLLVITKAFCTAPSNALGVIAGILPLDFRVAIDYTVFRLKHGDLDVEIFGEKFSGSEIGFVDRDPFGVDNPLALSFPTFPLWIWLNHLY